MRVALVSCGKIKSRKASRARELYRSPLFRMAFAHAARKFDRVFILSAKHGLLDPEKRIYPYDASLQRKTKAGRIRWAKEIAQELKSKFVAGDTLYFFCGSRYSENLAMFVRGHLRCVFPFRGLSLGKRMQWLKARRETYYKVLRKDLMSLGLRGATVMQYEERKWIRPGECSVIKSNDSGGLWVAKGWRNARALQRYVQKKHGISARMFRCEIGHVLFETSGRVKTDRLRLVEEV